MTQSVLGPRRRGRLGAAAAVVVTLALGLVGCSSTDEPDAPTSSGSTAGEAPAADTHSIATAYGDVEVPVDPERVVAVSYDTPWQLMSLGVTPVGAQDYSRYASSFSAEELDFIAQTSPVGTYGELDYEAILALDPDLIVGDAYEIDESIYDRLTEIAPTAIFAGADRGDWKAVVDGLGEATGATESLETVSAAYDAKIADLQDRYSAQIEDMSWALVTFGDQEVEFSVMYPTGITGAVYRDLGVTFAPTLPDEEPVSGYISLPYERIADVLGGADVIVTPVQADGTTYEAIQALFDTELFQQLPAAQQGHVYQVQLGITDYVSATQYLERVEQQVLAPLAG